MTDYELHGPYLGEFKPNPPRSIGNPFSTWAWAVIVCVVFWGGVCAVGWWWV